MISHADYLAGLAFNSAGLGWIACMSNAICAEYIAAPASECAAVFLPHALQYYGGGSETTRELFIDAAEAIGCAGDGTEDVVDACVLATARLVADLKLPETLRELTANRKLRMHKKEIPRLALRALRDTAAMEAARRDARRSRELVLLLVGHATVEGELLSSEKRRKRKTPG